MLSRVLVDDVDPHPVSVGRIGVDIVLSSFYGDAVDQFQLTPSALAVAETLMAVDRKVLVGSGGLPDR